jgi:hypothetical protein
MIHPTAPRTETPSLAAERDDTLLATVRAVDTTKPIGKDSASQIGFKLIHNVLGNIPPLLRALV